MKFTKNTTYQPRKKRKFGFNADIHILKKKLRIHLSKELRQRFKKRTLDAKKGDKVKVIKGEYRKREGKITDMDVKAGKIFIEGIMNKKQGGKEVPVAIVPANCIILEWAEPKKKEKRGKVAKTAPAQSNKQTSNHSSTQNKPTTQNAALNKNNSVQSTYPIKTNSAQPQVQNKAVQPQQSAQIKK